MKKTGALDVLGIWVSPLGDRGEAAIVRTDGDRVFGFGQTETTDLSRVQAERLSVGGTQTDEVAEDIAANLFDSFDRPDLVGYLGPVLSFERGVRLEEAGSGAMLAKAFGVPVAWDFLAQDHALGGASVLMPLAEFSAALMRHKDEHDAVIHLNLDARSQIHWVLEGQVVLATEPGPGIGLLSLAGTATGGRIVDAIPEEFLTDPFFHRMGPQVAPTSLSDKAGSALEGLDVADARMTATAMVVASVLQAIETGPFKPSRVFISGLGARDAPMLAMLEAGIGAPIEEVDATNVSACATAYIAARLVRGLTNTGPRITGVSASMASGRLGEPAAEE